MTKVIKYDPFEVVSVSSITEMRYKKDISELVISDIKKTRIEIAKIIAKYLSMSSKVKNINETWYDFIIDFIFAECKNLELQEVDFIFKNGIMGRLGCNYQEITLDTITGSDGWIENYYKDYRCRRKETDQSIINGIKGSTLKKDDEYSKKDDELLNTGGKKEKEPDQSKKLISHDEFLSRYPEYKGRDINVIWQKKTVAVEWTLELCKQRLGDQFDQLYHVAVEEYKNMIDRFELLEQIVKKEHTVVESAMYDAFLIQKKEGQEKFIIERLRRRIK